jgi:hypothetical protein
MGIFTGHNKALPVRSLSAVFGGVDRKIELTPYRHLKLTPLMI